MVNIQLEEDAEQLWSLLSSLSLLHGIPIQQEETLSLSKDHAIELCRYGGVELHNISALLGGVAAQEAVKILTHLYVPLANTFVFNGIAGVGGNYNL
jgi:amyloid beta precursor protein binding protein 1